MKHLIQTLDTSNDSFSYTITGAQTPLYVVDSSGYLFENGKQIGKFRLSDNQWHLDINDKLFMDGPKNALFSLPEFELKALTALLNQ